MKEPICVLRQTCEDLGAVLNANHKGIKVVCGRCKALIAFVLEDEAIKQGVQCCASCSKDEAHVKITWLAQPPEKSFWQTFDENMAALREEQAKQEAQDTAKDQLKDA